MRYLHFYWLVCLLSGLLCHRFYDAIVARVHEHKDLEELACYSTVPVINALSNYNHPLQVTALHPLVSLTATSVGQEAVNETLGIIRL